MKKILIYAVMLAAAGVFANAAKKLNSLNCAKVLAERNIVETVYGIKIKFTEKVTNFSKGNFLGISESKTGKRTIKGIEYDEKYDPKNDIAQVTATLKLNRISDIIDTSRFNISKYPDKVIKRVAFASSDPKNARKIAALRAAELDAYKNLYKLLCGFKLESGTRVENSVLKSDKVRSSVIGAVVGAEVTGYSWEGSGDNMIALVNLRMNIKELCDMLGQKVVNFDKDVVEVTGRGAPAPDPKKVAVKKSYREGTIDLFK